MHQLGTNLHFQIKCNPSIYYRGRIFLNIFSCLLALMKYNFNPKLSGGITQACFHNALSCSCTLQEKMSSDKSICSVLGVVSNPWSQPRKPRILYHSSLHEPFITSMGGFRGPESLLWHMTFIQATALPEALMH